MNLRGTEQVDLPSGTEMTPVEVIHPLIHEMFSILLGRPAITIDTTYDPHTKIAKCYAYQYGGKYALVEVLPEQEEPDRDPPEFGESQGM